MCPSSDLSDILTGKGREERDDVVYRGRYVIRLVPVIYFDQGASYPRGE